jgi:uncharacterized membrane protein
MQNETTLGVRMLHPRLAMLPIAFYTATLLGTLLFAMTQWVLCWRGALWMNVLGVLTALVAAVVGARDVPGLLRSGRASRKAVLAHVVFQGTAFALFAANLAVQQGAAALPPALRALASLVHVVKPDVTLALALSGAGLLLTMSGAVLGVMLTRSREASTNLGAEAEVEAVTTRLRAPLLP